MGNRFSLTIYLDHCSNGDQPVIAGNILRGKIILHVRRKIKPESLTLRLIGKENTIISSSKLQPPFRSILQSEHLFLRAYTKLREGGGDIRYIKKGTYTIPFEFQLPTSLPSSTQYPYAKNKRQIGKVYNCRIQYALIATLGSSVQEERILDIASSPLSNEVIPCLIQPTIHEIKKFGGGSLLNMFGAYHGSISIGACVNNVHVGRGETLKLSLTSRNDSILQIKKVKVKLVELIQYTNHNSNENSDQNGTDDDKEQQQQQQQERKTKVTLYEMDDIELPTSFKERRKSRVEIRKLARQKRLKNRRSQHDDEVSTTTTATYAAMYRDLVSNNNNNNNNNSCDDPDGNSNNSNNNNNRIHVVIPEYARDTYSGKLLTVSHYLKITYYTDSITADNPSTKIPIVIGNPPLVSRTSQQRQSSHHEQQQQHQQQQHQQPIENNAPIAIPVGHGAARVRPVGTTNSYDDGDDDDAASTWDIESTFTDIPMVHAVLLDQNSNVIPMSSEAASRTRRGGGRPISTMPTSLLSSPNDQGDSDAEEETIILETHEVFLEAGQTNNQQGQPNQGNRHRHDIDMDDYVGNYDGIEVLQPMVETVDDDGSSIYNGRAVGQATAQRLPTLSQLLEEMDAAVNVLQVFLIKEHNQDWIERFEELSHYEYGAIIAHASMEYQCRVATFLAKYISRKHRRKFTCDYCVSAIQNTSEYFRSNMVEALLPFCDDLASNHLLITNSLSEWEQVLTDRLIEDAIIQQQQQQQA